MSKTIYRYGESPKRYRKIFSRIGDALAIFGLVALVFLIIDTLFFMNGGLIKLILMLWRVI